MNMPTKRPTEACGLKWGKVECHLKFWSQQPYKVRKSVKVKRRDPIELYDTKLGYGIGGLYSNVLHWTYKDACKALETEGVLVGWL